MRARLEEHLAQRWPALFGDEDRPPDGGPTHLGCDHGDGWYGLVDALCEVLARRAARGGLRTRVLRTKEKRGSLRVHACDLDEFGRGAVDLAEELSLRTCEATGMPGRLRVRRGWYRTVAPDLAAAEEYAPVEWTRSVAGADGHAAPPPVPPPDLPDIALALGTRWAHLVDGPVAVPPGWADLADALLARLHVSAQPPRLWSLGRVDDALLAVLHGGGDGDRGAAALASALSRRVDPVTGAHRIPGDPP